MVSITNEQNMNIQSRVIQRRRTDLSSNYVATGTDEMNTDLSHIHNSNVYIIHNNSNNRHNHNRHNHNNHNNDNKDDNDDNQAIAAFVDSDSDSDADCDLNEAALITNNVYKVERMNKRLIEIFIYQRIVDPIVFNVKILSWYCNSCKAGGVIRCGIKASQRFRTRAIEAHLESDIHFKYAPEPVKKLLAAHKKAKQQRMTPLPSNYFAAS